jgi:hypothetical protein
VQPDFDQVERADAAVADPEPAGARDRVAQRDGSDEARFVTGATLPIDGGATAGE